MTIAEALKTGAYSLATHAIPSPEHESSLLLRHVLKCDAAFVYAHPDRRLNAMESILFKAVIKRRASHEPFQYIVGKQEFFGMDFEVTPDVLIPRPETEILVEAVIEEYKERGAFRFCEIGVGSGCISTALLANLPQSSAVGVDISTAAIEIAGRNARRHNVSERLELVHSDMFDGVSETSFDLFVSNPPYVPDGDLDSLQQEVKGFEPRVALTGGTDGLDIVRTLISQSPKYLIPNGFLFIEIGWDQSERVADLLDRRVWASFELMPDLQGIPRIVKARLN